MSKIEIGSHVVLTRDYESKIFVVTDRVDGFGSHVVLMLESKKTSPRFPHWQIVVRESDVKLVRSAEDVDRMDRARMSFTSLKIKSNRIEGSVLVSFKDKDQDHEFKLSTRELVDIKTASGDSLRPQNLACATRSVVSAILLRISDIIASKGNG